MMIYNWLNKYKKRFYLIKVQKHGNSFILDSYWGSCITNRGGKKNVSLSTEQEVINFIDKMMARRKSRGYEFVSNM